MGSTNERRPSCGRTRHTGGSSDGRSWSDNGSFDREFDLLLTETGKAYDSLTSYDMTRASNGLIIILHSIIIPLRRGGERGV